jgi:F420-non-reducing hydrogenase iron-sulfur subunit
LQQNLTVMPDTRCPDVLVLACANCLTGSGALGRQWQQDGVWAAVREVPCSGKIDVQYMLHTLEGGARGLCVVACPRGECHLAQGNYRAEIRVCTMQRLLSEMGISPERVELLHSSPQDSAEHIRQLVYDSVERIGRLDMIHKGSSNAG